MPRNNPSSDAPALKDTGHALDSIVQLSEALSDPTRLKILYVLLTGPKSLDAITKELGLDKKKKSNVKKNHLRELVKTHLIFQTRKYGDYELLSPELTVKILESLEEAWNKLDEIHRFLKEASHAYNNLIIPAIDAEKEKTARLAFDVAFDKIFKTDVFTKISGHLRSRYIGMTKTRKYEYDFSRLRDHT